MPESKQEHNPLDEFFAFCDQNFTPMTREECDELIRRVRAKAEEIADEFAEEILRGNSQMKPAGLLNSEREG